MDSPLRTVPVVERQPPEDRFLLPGFGLALDFFPVAADTYGVKNRSLFPTALDDRDIERGYISQPILTIREKHMLRLMDEFTDIPNWTSKVHDNSFVDNWKKQVLSRGVDISQPMLDWVVEELRFKAKVAKYLDAVTIYNGDVVKSDSEDLQAMTKHLNAAIAPLEKVAERVREYRIVTEDTERERDLVHPSLFPLVYGRSRILRDRIIGVDDAIASMGQGEVIEVPSNEGPSRTDMSWNIASRADISARPYSSRTQWLPSDVKFRPDGSCYFASYINNIHPVRHRELYPVIEKILDKIITMWDMTLTPVRDLLHSRSRIEYHNVQYANPVAGVARDRPEKTNQETQSEFEDRLHEWRKASHVLVQPDVGRFTPLAIPPQLLNELPPEERNKQRVEAKMDLRKEYGNRGLQVIVRIADVVLPPDKPVFESIWHVEGQMNEHICASALFFFDNENVHDPRDEFRQIADVQPLLDVDYEKGDSVWLEHVFGLVNNTPAVQEVGGITGRQGRAITWPNLLQHKTGDLRLKDPSKPGRCKVLNLMLVDPNIRIISTANVPPQRLDWKEGLETLNRDLAELSVADQAKMLKREGNFPWTLQEAATFLVEAREGRRAFNHYQDVAFHSKIVTV